MKVLFLGSSDFGHLDQKVVSRLEDAIERKHWIFTTNHEGFDILLLQYLKSRNYRKVTVFNFSFSNINFGYEMFSSCTETTMVDLADRIEVYGSCGNYMDFLLSSIAQEKIYRIM